MVSVTLVFFFQMHRLPAMICSSRLIEFVVIVAVVQGQHMTAPAFTRLFSKRSRGIALYGNMSDQQCVSLRCYF